MVGGEKLARGRSAAEFGRRRAACISGALALVLAACGGDTRESSVDCARHPKSGAAVVLALQHQETITLGDASESPPGSTTPGVTWREQVTLRTDGAGTLAAIIGTAEPKFTYNQVVHHAKHTIAVPTPTGASVVVAADPQDRTHLSVAYNCPTPA